MFREILAGTIGKKEVDEISDFLLHDSEQLEKVFRMIFDENQPLSWHAAWIIEKVSEKNPSLITFDKNFQLVNLVLINRHQGLQRICLSILYNLPIYQPISIEFVNKCFEWMLSPKSSIGVQALSMKILLRISEIEKDFRSELTVCLENTDDELYSAGFRASKRTVLKSLKLKD